MRPLMALITAGLLAFAHSATAQPATSANEAAKTVAGAWELSNADRDRSCTVTLKTAAGLGGFALDWERKCGELFAFTRSVTAWKIGARDVIQLVDPKAQAVLELTEVEGGLYEGERPGEGLLFLQSLAGGGNQERKAEQMVGEWAFTRQTGKPLCQITLAATAAAQDALALQVKPGCDALITRFGPVAWRLDRGQLVLIPSRGDAWRFEESDPTTWRRIPEGRQPLQLVKQ